MGFSFRLFLTLSIAPALMAQTQFTKDVQALSPLGFWTLSGNANDSSGHGNNGFATPGMFFTNLANCPAEPQAAVFSSASNQFIAIPGSGAASSIFNLNAQHAMTAMAWIRTVGMGRGSQILMSKIDPGTNTGWVLGIDNGDLGPQGGGRLIFGFFVNSAPVLAVESTVGVTNGNWIFVSATYDGSGKASGIHLYINAANQPTTTLADSLGGASIVNTAPVTIGAAPDASGIFEGNMAGAAFFGTVLTATQNLQLADDSNDAKAILAQFVFGGGWYSALYFSNILPAQVSFPVTFTGDDGNPLNVPSIGSSKTITIPPGGSAVIEAPNAGPLSQGYASVTVPIGVTGYGVFRQSAPGIADQEAVVPLASVGAANQYLVYDETNFITGVALVNPGSTAATITITAMDLSGAVIATSDPIVLPPFNKTEAALRSLPSLAHVEGRQGVARFSVPSGSVSVLGLRFKGAAFTSIPAVPLPQLTKFPGTP